MSYSKWEVSGSSFMYQFLNKISPGYDALIFFPEPLKIYGKQKDVQPASLCSVVISDSKICILPAVVVIRYEMDVTDSVNETTVEANFWLAVH